jgi:DNA-binding CsgD family transcriptional regulator
MHLPDAEFLLRDVLAAARDTVARCERALSLLAEFRERAPRQPTAGTRPDATLMCSPVLLDPYSNGYASHPSEGGGTADLDAGRLSPREAEILHWIAAGLSNRQIADRLFLSPRTVERHIANIYLKIDVHTKADAVVWARCHWVSMRSTRQER